MTGLKAHPGPNPYHPVTRMRPRCLFPVLLALAALGPMPATSTPRADPAQLNRGARAYRALCLACHLPDGRGVAGVTPPLAGSDYLLADRDRAVLTVLKGLAGPIRVNGVAYEGVMPGLEQILSDQQIADVLTYVFNTWGNAGPAFAPDHVARLRAATRDRPRVTAPPGGAP